MPTEDERADMVQIPDEPLVRVPDDAMLPSTIYSLDTNIAAVEQELQDLKDIRADMLKRAVALNIFSDSETVIVKKEKNLPRKIDPSLFRQRYPAKYTLAIVTEKQKLQDKIDTLHEKIDKGEVSIAIQTANALMHKNEVDLICYPHEVQVSYIVQKVSMLLPAASKR